MITRYLFVVFLFLNLQSQSQTKVSLECIDREFSVLVHVLRDKSLIPVITNAAITNAIGALNNAWKPICIQFKHCETRYVDNYNFMSWNADSMELEFKSLYFEPRVINVIVVDNIIVPGGISGYASLAGIADRKQPIIVLTSSGGNLVWIHEFGHYFGLEHTFKAPWGKANMSDCSTADDGLCDTPPDPNTSSASPNPLLVGCTYVGNQMDPNGAYYNPLVENYMSYYGGCRKSFTHQQYERMVKTYYQDPKAHF